MDTLARQMRVVAQGNSLLQAQQQAIQWIGHQVQAQALFLAYTDAFWVLMLISLAAVPLALSLRKVKLGGSVQVGPLSKWRHGRAREGVHVSAGSDSDFPPLTRWQ